MINKKEIKILIVDDNEELCDLLVELFSHLGVSVRGVYSASAALDIIYNENISIVVSDIHMPVKDGIFLLKKIKEHNPDFPRVLFISGKGVDLETCYNLGIEGFFAKPFNIEEVKKAVMRCLLDKKSWWRYPLNNVKGRITKRYYDFDEFQRAKDVAFGKSGIFIGENHQFYNPGDQCDFKIRLVAGSPFKTLSGQGVIRWVRRPGENKLPPGMGIEVLHIDRQNLGFYLDFIENLNTVATIPICG